MFDFVVGVIIAGGLLGVALLMLAENVAPPIPSELIMPLAGFAAAQGHMSFPGVVIAGTMGAVAGALLWYLVGWRVSPATLDNWVDRHGRWLTVDAEDLARARRQFARRGVAAVFVGRLIPGVRTFVSVPAGLTRMPLPTFLLWTTLGTSLWTLFLASAGYLLKAEYHLVAGWLDPITEIILIGIVALYVFRVIRMRRRK